MKKRWWIVVIPILLYLLISWYYPYSWWSMHQTYDYEADPVFARDYKNKIENFKKSYTINPKDKLTTETTGMAVEDLFTEKWLVTDNPVSVEYAYLDKIKNDVQSIRQNFTHLDRKGPEYTPHAQNQLYLLIDTLESIEKEVDDIKDMRNGLMRSDADNVLNNLHVSVAASADMLIEFYGAHQNGE
ncbi:hypothetical protein ACFFJY_02535 [Fictibacillus aquaticus]|uniref:Uncharacterized protein n=1 Tax=Fictibacillus aquaticus TaxID=2021314 RepID=A0A235F8A4_9BACL|nr:hypothetical protein [Fictibacillus aquaticus]OYD57581.1 hypothetical protein CGZ90_13005 [Fictibacillus aquaticus]